MKKTILSISVFVCFTLSVFAQIPNAGFENWTNIGNYDNPDNWATLNNTTATFSVFTATKATPGNPGTSYLKLTSRTVGSSVMNGIAVSGKFDSISLKPKSGFAYTQRPAALGGKWQHMIYGSSQGGISVLLTKWNNTKSKRDTIANGATTLSGMAMSWANFSFNLAYVDSFNYPDSCIIVLKASGANPTNNDYLWIDALALTGTVAVLPPPPPPNLVGLNENNQSLSKISLFPNPSNQFVNLNFDLARTNKIAIEITDLNGKIVQEIFLNNLTTGNNKVRIETTKLAKGIYTLSIKENQTIYHNKLVVE